jgi:hypothetical protein
MFTQSNQYHVVLEVAKDFRNEPGRSSGHFRSLRRGHGSAAEFFHAL